jgi:hypothetical protein
LNNLLSWISNLNPAFESWDRRRFHLRWGVDSQIIEDVNIAPEVLANVKTGPRRLYV